MDPYTEYFMQMKQIMSIECYNNAAIASQWVIDIMKKHKLPLQKIESILRSINCQVYLIGLPLSYFEQEQYKFKILHPFETKLLKYVLWIEVNGLDSLEQLLKRNNLTDVDRSLTNTGFLGLNCENNEL
jgi:hypothetical protein